WLAHVNVECSQTTQDLPGAINVVHTPTAIPRTVVFLLQTDVIKRVTNATMTRGEILVTEQFQNARGNVGAFRIEHRVVIGEQHGSMRTLLAVSCSSFFNSRSARRTWGWSSG